MNPVVVELKISMPSKAQAARLIQLFQLMTDSLPNQIHERGEEFLKQLQGHGIILSATYRERKDSE